MTVTTRISVLRRIDYVTDPKITFPSGRSPSGSARQDFHFEKDKQFFGFWTCNVRFNRFISGYIESLTVAATRLGCALGKSR